MAKVVILGGGESGVGSAILAQKKGFEVFLSDKGKIAPKYLRKLKKYGIECESGTHTESKMLDADFVVKSPGIPATAPIVQKFIAQGTPIISEIEFAGRYDNAFKICITGSNGKTTTTSLVYHILKTAGFNVGLGGNIGKSYAEQVALASHDYYVLELSSFQLDNMYDYRADVAVVTNVTPDHLDRYDHKLENYTAAKFRVAQNMTKAETFIYNADDPITMDYMEANGSWIKANMLAINSLHYALFTELGAEASLVGRHNMYNCLMAYAAAKAAGVPVKAILKGLKTFKPVEHRLEKVAVKKGVEYINDSKATNIDAAFYALDAQTKPIVWIVGGTDKGNDYSTLSELVAKKVKAIVCLGVDNSKIHAAYESLVPVIEDSLSARECVEKCARLASKGDVVLLSPCCASFDLFKNYEDRGRQFKSEVLKLK